MFVPTFLYFVFQSMHIELQMYDKMKIPIEIANTGKGKIKPKHQ